MPKIEKHQEIQVVCFIFFSKIVLFFNFLKEELKFSLTLLIHKLCVSFVKSFVLFVVKSFYTLPDGRQAQTITKVITK